MAQSPFEVPKEDLLDSALPDPRWWHLPEYRGVISLALFGMLGSTNFMSGRDAPFDPVALMPAMMLLGLSLARIESYENPDRQPSRYSAVLFGTLMALFISLSTADQFWFFVVVAAVVFVFFTALFMVPRRPRLARYDRSLVYSDPFSPHGPSFTAKRLKYWPFITLVAIAAVLTLTQSPAWAILTGASFLAFTPSAYARNPVTARPVLAQLLNLIALCLIAAAAYTLTF